MNYIIRKLRQEEVKCLDTFLYEAIFIPEGVEALPMEIINQLIDTVKSERPTLSGRPADEEIDDGEEIILDAKEIYYLDHVDRKLFAYTKDGLNSFVHSRYHTSFWLDFITIEYFQRQRSRMH